MTTTSELMANDACAIMGDRAQTTIGRRTSHWVLVAPDQYEMVILE